MARIAKQVVVLYENAIESAQSQDISPAITKVPYYKHYHRLLSSTAILKLLLTIDFIFVQYWIDFLKAKRYYFEADTHHRKSMEALSNSQYGQEVAQIQLAKEAIEEAFQFIEQDKNSANNLNPVLTNDIKSSRNVILETAQRAIADNDLIYLDSVPTASSLSSVSPVKMAKITTPDIIATPENFSGESELGSPLFKALLPFVVHEAASVYEDRKEQLVVRDIIASLDELTAKCEK